MHLPIGPFLKNPLWIGAGTEMRTPIPTSKLADDLATAPSGPVVVLITTYRSNGVSNYSALFSVFESGNKYWHAFIRTQPQISYYSTTPFMKRNLKFHIIQQPLLNATSNFILFSHPSLQHNLKFHNIQQPLLNATSHFILFNHPSLEHNLYISYYSTTPLNTTSNFILFNHPSLERNLKFYIIQPPFS